MNRNALITGAAGGCGPTVTPTLAQAGWALVLVSCEPAQRRFGDGRAEARIAARYPLRRHGRHGKAEDAAQPVAWLLLSEQADRVTGHVLPVDGGFAAVRPAVKARA
jgi:NAD(P)-dependent dehydrogenase (short-subunit alcohol dehydrogenase family)